MAKKQKKKTYLKKERTIVLSVFGVMILGVVLFFTINFISNNYLLKIDNTSVAKDGELELYYYEQAFMYLQYGLDLNTQGSDGLTYRDYLKQDAMNLLIQTKLTEIEAKAIGLELTEEQKNQIPENLTEMKTNYGEDFFKKLGLSDSDLETMSATSLLANNMFEHVVKDYVRDEEDFANEFTTYMEANRESMTTRMVHYIETDTEEDAATARERLLAGEDYETVFKELCRDYDPEKEDFVIEQVDLANRYYPSDATSQIYELAVGDMSEVIPVYDRFAVVKVLEITPPDENEVRETFASQYDTQKKQEIFGAELTKWEEKHDVKVNTSRFAKLCN